MRPGRKWNKTAALELAGLPYRTRTTLAHSSRCPVTRGQPTRLTDPTWRRMCQALRDPGNLACSQCHEGDNPPAELTIVTADQLTTTTTNKENDMSMYGECEICGEKKKIRSVRNKNACATCEHIWRAANVNPDLVLKTLTEAKGEDYLRQEVWPSPKSADQVTESDQVLNHIWANNNLEPGADIEAFVDNLVAESEWLKNRLDATKHIIATIRDQLDLDEGQPILEAVALLQQERQEAVDACNATVAIIGNPFRSFASIPTAVNDLMALRDEWNDLVNRMGQIRAALHAEPDADLVQQAEVVNHLALLFNQVEAVLGIDGQDSEEAPQLIAEMMVREKQLLQKIADLEAIVDNDPFTETSLEWTSPDTRTEALLNLALDVIAGRVSGIDADRIAALR
jgi:hypothetical protein